MQNSLTPPSWAQGALLHEERNYFRIRADTLWIVWDIYLELSGASFVRSA